MTFYSMMLHGGVIEVDKTGYCPTTFWCEKRKIFCNTAVLGERARRDDMSAKQFNEHIGNMIAEGFEVTIRPNGGKDNG